MGFELLVIIVFSIVVLVFSGFVKGAIGFGLPLVAVPLLTIVNPVHTSLAILSIPVLVSSIKLAFAGGRFGELSVKYKWLVFGMVAGAFIGVLALRFVDPNRVLIILGVSLIFLTIIGLFKPQISLNRKPLGYEMPVGLAAGTIGGLTSAFGPIVATYLTFTKVSKDEFVTVLNIMLLAGSTAMVVALGAFGIFTKQTFPLSLAACLPVVAGMALGTRLRSKLNAKIFRNIILFTLFVIGINMIRRGISS